MSETKNVYHRLFATYWCAIRRHTWEWASVVYGCTLLSVLIMLFANTIWFACLWILEPLRFWFRSNPTNIGLIVLGMAEAGNLLYYFHRSRWRRIVPSNCESNFGEAPVSRWNLVVAYGALVLMFIFMNITGFLLRGAAVSTPTS